MSTFYLVNDCRGLRLAGQSFSMSPGELVDDAAIDVTTLKTEGAVFWPSSDTLVAAAAAIAQKKKAQGADETVLQAIMFGGVSQSLISGPAGGSAALATDPNAAAPEAAIVKHLQIDVPLTTLQAKLSGTEFNIGAALPANAEMLTSQVNVLEALAGGTASAAKVFVQQATKTAGEVEGGAGGIDAFAGVAIFHGAGSNPYPSRGGQQLAMKVTLTGDTMAHLTAGHLQVDVFYVVVA